MIHENDKKQQPEEQDFMEMIIGNDRKNPQQEQQAVTHVPWEDRLVYWGTEPCTLI